MPEYFKRITTGFIITFQLLLAGNIQAQTIPNNSLETWINHGQYDDPQSWDTPNQEVCFFPFYTKVVTKSTDHESGSFSAKLETKDIPVVNITVPGLITLGTITINIAAATYTISGGVPINDMPTHLKGFYKFQPKGGDSCAIGIGLSKWTAGVGRDSIGIGVFSTHDTITTWTPFSAWIDYSEITTPDTMNILAISSASFTPTAGTILYVDDLYLDYTTALNDEDPGKGIDIYQDRELHELLVYFNFPSAQSTSLRLYNIMGQKVFEVPSRLMYKESVKYSYMDVRPGLYILEIVHNDKKFCRKFILDL
jgi:hypothetical protein